MKRLLVVVLVATVVSSSTGCLLIDHLFHCRLPGGHCGPAACATCGPAYDAAPAGPPTAAVTYPYYTTRGPRDFLASDPRGIGP